VDVETEVRHRRLIRVKRGLLGRLLHGERDRFRISVTKGSWRNLDRVLGFDAGGPLLGLEGTFRFHESGVEHATCHANFSANVEIGPAQNSESVRSADSLEVSSRR